MKGIRLYTWTAKVCERGSDHGATLTDLNTVGMFSRSYNARYPPSGKDNVNSPAVAEFRSSSEHLEPTSVPTQLKDQSCVPVAEESQTETSTAPGSYHDVGGEQHEKYISGELYFVEYVNTA